MSDAVINLFKEFDPLIALLVAFVLLLSRVRIRIEYEDGRFKRIKFTYIGFELKKAEKTENKEQKKEEKKIGNIFKIISTFFLR